MAGLEFNPEQVRKLLQDGFTAKKFSEALRKHWCEYVPKVYSAKMDADANKEERKAQRLLFRPMEEFLCGGDPDVVFKQLKDQDQPPQLCGKKFKMGEPTYACRDCGYDPTCVLCFDCFQNSTHKKHRYKMSTSGGGGYCDCGDKEAWKTDPFCDVHTVGEESEESAPAPCPLDTLPPDLAARARHLFSATINYATQLLTWTDTEVLPPDLMPLSSSSSASAGKLDDTYTTMLFNDEVHTYEQVISTLQKAVDCSQHEARVSATTVDREGRSLVRYGSYVDCNKAKEIIEKTTTRLTSKPLKVKVMHSSVVAHQQFALRMLSWLQTVITYSDGLRKMFCLLSIEKQPESIIEKMLLADTQLWKVARVQSHQLFMSGVLMDQECKKKFAVIFTTIYGEMMQCFMEDDHDHSVCAVSESVQIYTVPTLARMLVREYNLLEIILNTFLSHCKNKINSEGKFAFDRQERNQQSFRRAQFALYDLKYALTAVPSPKEWDNDLRKNFLRGFKAMLDLLKAMQGMDAVTRQAGQHIEFEPEWEGAFNLQLKLSDNIAIMLDWCSTDKKVLMDAFGLTVETIKVIQREAEKGQPSKFKSCTVGNHTVNCIDYDVSSQPVSIHLPVSRMLAGLYPRINQHNIELQALHLEHYVSPMELMEPCVRCLVLIAQTQAGMWRRNGYSLLNQIYFYHNVRCRSEMYDMDILMLQAAAATANPNHFLIHLLNKYGLLNWIKPTYDEPSKSGEGPEDSVRQVVTLVGEFLYLLLILFGERYTVGVGAVEPGDNNKREIIHQLSVQPMAHSELAKMLPEDPYHETGIEEAVHAVATFKKPKDSMSKGMYELKPECYSQYNPFFWHYSRADQSKSEEEQRKRRKEANESLALPPPAPPAFCKNFEPITRMLHSDIFLLIIRTVLTRTVAKRSKSWSEAQFEKTLHLVCVALYEDRRRHEQRGDEMAFVLRAGLHSPSILSLLDAATENTTVMQNPMLADLLTFTINLYRSVMALRDGSPMETGSGSGADKGATPTPSSSKLARERKKKAEIAAKRRAKLMNQMQRMQREFIKGNSELFENTSTEIVATGTAMDVQSSHFSEVQYPVVVGPHRSKGLASGTRTETCILCQEEQEIRHNTRAMVLAAFVQKSTVLSKDPDRRQISDPANYNPMIMPSDLFLGTFASTCGHTMHADCWQSYYNSIVVKERRRMLRFHHHISFDVEKFEFLCPLCETLSNTVIPLMPKLDLLRAESSGKDGGKVEAEEVELSLNDWLDGITKTVKNSTQQARDKKADDEDAWIFVPCPLSSISKMMASSNVAKNFTALFEYYAYGITDTCFSDSITEMLKKFATDTYAIGLGVNPDQENPRVPLMAWNTCAFTLMTTEQVLRTESKPLFGSLPARSSECISSLVRFATSCSQVIAPEVVKKHCVMLLSALMSGTESSSSSGSTTTTTACLLDMELFHYLVSVCLSLPTLYAAPPPSPPAPEEPQEPTEEPTSTSQGRISTGSSLNDLHVLHWVYTAHVVQVMLAADFEHQECMETETDEEGEAMMHWYIKVRQLAGLDVSTPPSPWQLYLYLKEACLPFLRCCALFFHFLTDVQPSEELTEIPACLGQYEPLCRYLSLPITPSTLFAQGDVLNTMIASWCTNGEVKERLAKQENVIRYPLVPNPLVVLPDDYSQLINTVSTFTCPRSVGDDSRAPTMCLVCGEMLCSQSYCCQTELDGNTVGAATAHAQTCGAGTSLFLRVRECQVLLLQGRSKGCFYPPPYLDDYGETDQGLRRGNPLHLSEESFKKLHKIWLSHSIPEKIAHMLEHNSNLMTIEWQHL